jgi:hypothetical protein
MHNMAYYSSAELEYNARYGGNDYYTGINHDPSWWQNYIFKRQGCREITIPIAKQAFNTSPEYYIKVSDLGSGTSLDDEWFRQEPFFYKVDQTLCYSYRDVVLKLQPGEGRILKFERKSLCELIDRMELTIPPYLLTCRWDAAVYTTNGQLIPCISKIVFETQDQNGNWLTYRVMGDQDFPNFFINGVYRLGGIYGYYNSTTKKTELHLRATFYVYDENEQEVPLSCVPIANDECANCMTDAGVGVIDFGVPVPVSKCGINVKVPVSNPENGSCLSAVNYEKQVLVDGQWEWQSLYYGSPSAVYLDGFYQFANQCAEFDPSHNVYRLNTRVTFYTNDGSEDIPMYPSLEKDTTFIPPQCCTQSPVQYTMSDTCSFDMKFYSVYGCEAIYGIAKSEDGGDFTTILFNSSYPIISPDGLLLETIQLSQQGSSSRGTSGSNSLNTVMSVVYRLLDQNGSTICNLSPIVLDCNGGIIHSPTGMDKDSPINQNIICYAVPNPATNETEIYYQVPGSSDADVSIELYGVLGNQIMEVFKGRSSTGLNHVKLY